MKVRAIAVTQPLITVDGNEFREGMVSDRLMTPDEFIAYVARVSNPENQSNTLTATKLLKYLAKHSHWSPFEMADMCIEIETTRDIGRQILRHKSFVFQEFSQRYADPTKSLGFTTRQARLQDTKNRQNSVETSDDVLEERWQVMQKGITERAVETYEWAIKNGIAKEQARAILPEGLTLSRLYMKGSVRSWIHYCQLRMGNGTQKEHREIATACWAEVIRHFPSLSEVIINE